MAIKAKKMKTQPTMTTRMTTSCPALIDCFLPSGSAKTVYKLNKLTITHSFIELNLKPPPSSTDRNR